MSLPEDTGIPASALLKAIPETSYLTAQNVGRYRCLMRYFYLQHQRLRYWLKPEEVFRGVMEMDLLPDYTLELCQKDLNQLVQWQDLVPRHDGGRACTVEEYLRKRFVYQMTPYAVEIERLVINLEKVRGYGGSLEPSLFETIENGLRQLAGYHDRPFTPGEAEALWQTLYETFTRLVDNASDYIASLQSSKAEELMATEAFLAYKDAVTGYLETFVRGLQRHAFKIEGLLPNLPAGLVASFLDAVVADYSRKPQLDEPFDPLAERERLEGEWHSLERWFIGAPGETSDVVFLERATKDTIARLVRHALRIQEKRRWGVSRRRELDYLGRWFFSLNSLEEAHRLAACAFGLYRTRHFQGSDERDTDNPDVSSWEVPPGRQRCGPLCLLRILPGGSGGTTGSDRNGPGRSRTAGCRVGGTVRLTGLTPQERQALGGLLGRNLEGQDSLQVSLPAVEKILKESRWEVDLPTALALYGDEAPATRPQVQATKRQAWQDFCAAALDRAKEK